MGELSFTAECDGDIQAELCEQPSPLQLSDTSICSWLPPHSPSQQRQPKQQPDILFLLSRCPGNRGLRCLGVLRHLQAPQEPTKSSEANQEMSWDLSQVLCPVSRHQLRLFAEVLSREKHTTARWAVLAVGQLPTKGASSCSSHELGMLYGEPV